MAIKKNKMQHIKEIQQNQEAPSSPSNKNFSENKNSPNTPDELKKTKEASNFIWKGIKLILKTTWGMRIALILLGIILFYVGFAIGNIGKSSLRNIIDDKISDIKLLKSEIAEKDKKISELTGQINKLKLKLSESEQKRLFFLQRNKIRKPLQNALIFWKSGKKKETLEQIYKSVMNLNAESKSSLGISSLFYSIIKSKLNNAIKLIEKTCSEQPAQIENKEKSEQKTDSEPKCKKTVTNILETSLQILISPETK